MANSKKENGIFCSFSQFELPLISRFTKYHFLHYLKLKATFKQFSVNYRLRLLFESARSLRHSCGACGISRARRTRVPDESGEAARRIGKFAADFTTEIKNSHAKVLPATQANATGRPHLCV